ncbi:MAG: DUF420 domain-containing protein [Planctomycetota bacterium]|nr:DUF420 domain-containing protein [Planctomycetota bacterium]
MDPAVFPALNAVLNSCAGVLLIVGVVLIHRGRERAHKNAMLAAFGCSILFLASYLWFHFHYRIRVEYAGPDWGRTPYLVMLLAHTVLAAVVPFLAMRTIWLGLRDRRPAHRRLARITFPIWLFVSVTGVLIYFVLYQWTGSGAAALHELRLAAGAAE